ncbi:MAG: hypothetical protein K0S79_111 [Nitrospira sp.]|jgi:hypothetical protein|nr:hypothetical protein [Nitrospira sp.]
MARRVSTAAILKANIEGRSVEEISVSLKIPVSDVVKAVSDPKFKRDLLDYRLMRGLQQFETIGNLKGYLHGYVKCLKEVMEQDPDFFKNRIKDPKVEVYKELKGMMDVIRIATELTDKELKKMMREAEEQEDPSLAAAQKRLKEKNKYKLKKTQELIELKAEVIGEQGLEHGTEVPHVEGNHGDSLGSEREDSREAEHPGAGAAVHRDSDNEAPIIRGDNEDGSGGEDQNVRSYLLEE